MTFRSLLLAAALVALTLGSPLAQARSPCPNAIRINTNYQYRGGLHFICLQATSARPRLDVIQYANQQLIGSLEVNEVGTNQLASFVDNEGTLRIMVAAPNRINGTSVYSVDPAGRFLEDKHTINTQLVSTMNIWRLQLNWQWQLATANGPLYGYQRGEPGASSPPPDPKPMISIHSWRATYFDLYQLIYLPHDGRVNKLEPMHINDQEFLIVAMDAHPYDYHYPGSRLGQQQQQAQQRQLAPPAYSLIYKLDFGDGSLGWVHYQNLNTELALDASSFSISHRSSLQRDYYIALIGQPQAVDDAGPTAGLRLNQTAPADDYGLIIYKYLGDRFFQVQSIAVPGATKLETISYGIGDTYVIIAILNGWTSQFSLYSYDGLSLRPIPGPTRAAAAPPPPPLGAAGQTPGQQRHRRTKYAERNMHLFMAPRVADQSNDTNAKRTLADESGALALPVLAFSNPLQASSANANDTTTTTTTTTTMAGQPAGSQDTLFEIPLAELSQPEQELGSSSQAGDNSGHSKRNFVDVGRDLFAWCRAAIDRLKGDNFDAVLAQLRTLPRVDQSRPIEIAGDLIIEGDLHVTNLLYANQIEDQQRRAVLADDLQPLPAVNFSQTFWDIEQQHQKIDLIKERVDQILVDDGSIQEVFAPLSFERLEFECSNPVSVDPRLQPMQLFSGSCPLVNEVQAILLNNRHNISDIRQQALVTGRSMSISRDVRFEHLVLRGNTRILQTLNDIPIGEIVFAKSGPIGPIGGRKTFLNGLFSAAHVQTNSWNGQLVDRQMVLTSSGEQHIDADLKFSRVVLESAVASVGQNAPPGNVSSRFDRLNNLDLSVHLAQIALANEDNTFEAPILFEELVLNGPSQLTANARLSGLAIDDVWLNTMFKHAHQNVLAPVEFVGDVHVSYGGDILANGTVNGVHLNPDSVMMRNRDYDLPNPVVFAGDVQLTEAEVLRGLNEIQAFPNGFSQRHELAILTDGGQQFVSGDKIFNELHLAGRSHFHGLINGHLNVTQLHQLATSRDNNAEPFRFSTVRISGHDIRLASGTELRVANLINGIAANEVCALATNAAQMTSNQYQRLKFHQEVRFKSLRCASINGFNNLTRSFLTKFGGQHVAGTLRLMNGLVFNTSLNIGSTLNGLAVAPLSQAIARAIDEARTGHKDIYGDLRVDELVVERINELQLADVFITKSDEPQLIRAPMRFDHLDIENILLIGADLMANSFNGLNVSDLLLNTLQYDAPQVIYNHVELHSLHLLGGANLATKSVNGYDLQRLFNDAVLLDVAQQILAPKTFRAPVHFNDRVFLQHAIDGLSEAELRFNLLLQSDELIDDDLEFANPVTIARELEIQSGLINDIDIEAFVKSILNESAKGMRIVGNSSVRFKNVQLSQLATTGTIQGVDVSRDAILRVANGSTTRLPPAAPPTRPSQPPYQMYSTLMVTPLPPRPVSLRPQPPELAPPMFQPLVGAPPRLSVIANPLNWINETALPQNMWRPDYHAVQAAQKFTNQPVVVGGGGGGGGASLDASYAEHVALSRGAAIRDLIGRVNRYLPVSFYYEIVQKHPLLGPLLHAADNPIRDEEGRALLLLKATSKPGEPCLQRGQTIAVMAQQRQRGPSAPPFTLDSRIQETSDPSLVQSLVVGGVHYLFILDSYAEGSVESVSQVLVYLWDHRQGMYELKQRRVVDGAPTAMKAFAVGATGCLALASPRLAFASNHTGAPMLLCQRAPLGDFDQLRALPMRNVFDLEVAISPAGQLIVAGLAQHVTEQIGDLIIGQYDFQTGTLRHVIARRIVRPMRLHFIRRPADAILLHLALSEATTSDDARAITRVFSLSLAPKLSLVASQLIKDDQFDDIQSVLLNGSPILFLRSVHSIAIYYQACEARFELLQRVPTRGANRFLVFNSNAAHFLVLSRDDCAHYSTIILRAKFVN